MLIDIRKRLKTSGKVGLLRGLDCYDGGTNVQRSYKLNSISAHAPAADKAAAAERKIQGSSLRRLQEALIADGNGRDGHQARSNSVYYQDDVYNDIVKFSVQLTPY